MTLFDAKSACAFTGYTFCRFGTVLALNVSVMVLATSSALALLSLRNLVSLVDDDGLSVSARIFSTSSMFLELAETMIELVPSSNVAVTWSFGLPVLRCWNMLEMDCAMVHPETYFTGKDLVIRWLPAMSSD